MNRRNALASLSGVAASSLLLAVSSRTALAQQTPTSSAPGGKPLDASEAKTQTLMLGTLSKQTSQLALTQATHPQVKQFAAFEIAEQTTIAQTLTDTANPPPANLDQMQRGVLTKLEATQGKAFDAAYVAAQIRAHHMLYAVQQDYLNTNPTDLDREHIAMLARTVIQMHLTMLADLQTMITAA